MRHETRPITFSAHALRRLAGRHINKADAEHAVRTGYWRPNAPEGWVSRAAFNGRVYDIVFVETEDGGLEVLHVVTVIEKKGE